MKTPYVLILGRQHEHALHGALKDLGFTPMSRGSVLHCVEKLRCWPVAAVIMERDFTHADVLEFLLNVRDIDEGIPFIVIGRSTHDRVDRMIASQRRTVLLEMSPQEQRRPSELKSALAAVLPDVRPQLEPI